MCVYLVKKEFLNRLCPTTACTLPRCTWHQPGIAEQTALAVASSSPTSAGSSFTALSEVCVHLVLVSELGTLVVVICSCSVGGGTVYNSYWWQCVPHLSPKAKVVY